MKLNRPREAFLCCVSTYLLIIGGCSVVPPRQARAGCRRSRLPRKVLSLRRHGRRSDVPVERRLSLPTLRLRPTCFDRRCSRFEASSCTAVILESTRAKWTHSPLRPRSAPSSPWSPPKQQRAKRFLRGPKTTRRARQSTQRSRAQQHTALHLPGVSRWDNPSRSAPSFRLKRSSRLPLDFATPRSERTGHHYLSARPRAQFSGGANNRQQRCAPSCHARLICGATIAVVAKAARTSSPGRSVSVAVRAPLHTEQIGFAAHAGGDELGKRHDVRAGACFVQGLHVRASSFKFDDRPRVTA